MGIEHACIMCAFIAGWWYRGHYDVTQKRIGETKTKIKVLGAELARRGGATKAIAPYQRPTEQSFYDDDLTQCIHDAARKAGVMDEEEERETC